MLEEYYGKSDSFVQDQGDGIVRVVGSFSEDYRK